MDWLEEKLGAQQVQSLRSITTRWSVVTDINLFVLRYSDAINGYLAQVLKDQNDADEVTQVFLTRLLERGLLTSDPNRGRFRDYLIKAVKNAAITFLRKSKRGLKTVPILDLDPESDVDRPDHIWESHWRRCLLERAFAEMEDREQKSPSSFAATTLRLQQDHPKATSEEKARLLSEKTGESISAGSFRQKLRRARRSFAEFLTREIAETLGDPTSKEIESELKSLGLGEHLLDLAKNDGC
ncbi:MAG: sigma-70 family RNA polymerase sigma factor [Planctomycetota bacterium]